MAIHAITFRIHQDRTYDHRYQSVVNAIEKLTESTYWDGTTSFTLVESHGNSGQVAEKIDRIGYAQVAHGR